MSRAICQISMSLDGYVAGPQPTAEEPLGRGGERLHEWAFAGDAGPAIDADMIARLHEGIGAFVMGRRMFDGGEGPLDPAWKGWWGDEPPYHAPVFVVTHHAREPLAMAGGTTFFFVTDGFDAALDRARAAAGDADVLVAGGGSVVAQALAAGALDELHLHVPPVLLGGGTPLFAGAGDPALEPVEAVTSPACTHVRYRVGP